MDSNVRPRTWRDSLSDSTREYFAGLEAMFQRLELDRETALCAIMTAIAIEAATKHPDGLDEFFADLDGGAIELSAANMPRPFMSRGEPEDEDIDSGAGVILAALSEIEEHSKSLGFDKEDCDTLNTAFLAQLLGEYEPALVPIALSLVADTLGDPDYSSDVLIKLPRELFAPITRDSRLEDLLTRGMA